MTGSYRIADLDIRMQTLHPLVHQMCQPYGTCPPPSYDVEINTTQHDIDAERLHTANEQRMEGLPLVDFPDNMLETTAAYRQLATQLPRHNGLLMHASTVAVDGNAYLFLAKSGTGKSTHTRLWRQMLGERAVMINDDKPIVRLQPNGSAQVYGTPWDGKHHLSTNTSAPIKALCWLCRGDENSITKLSVNEAFGEMLQQTFRPPQPDVMAQTLQLLTQLLSIAPIYKMHCLPNIQAAEMAYNAMSR